MYVLKMAILTVYIQSVKKPITLIQIDATALISSSEKEQIETVIKVSKRLC